MALTGTYIDHYKDMFKDMLLMQAQDEGARLEKAVMVEALEGNKTFIDKIGSVEPTIKSTRNADSIFAEHSFERRQVQEEFAEFATLIDVEDVIKQASNPKSSLIRAATFSLGRRKDSIIMDAIGGNAVVTANGVTSNQALTLSVAKASTAYGGTTSALSTAKLKEARTKMEAAYGYNGMGKLICIAPAAQLMNLTQENQMVSGDFRVGSPLEGAGVHRALSGYLGIEFIAYEDTGLDGSGDQKVFLITDDAVTLGVYVPLTVDIRTNANKQGNPDQLKVWEALGAVRRYEEKVVQIACSVL